MSQPFEPGRALHEFCDEREDYPATPWEKLSKAQKEIRAEGELRIIEAFLNERDKVAEEIYLKHGGSVFLYESDAEQELLKRYEE